MPPEYLEMFLNEDATLPQPDAVLGLEDARVASEPSEPPHPSDLLQDPDVAAVVEAADGLEPVG